MRRLIPVVTLIALVGCGGMNPLAGSGTVTYRVNGTRADLMEGELSFETGLRKIERNCTEMVGRA